MTSPLQQEACALNGGSPPEFSVRVFSYLVRLLRSPNVIQCSKNHPAAYNEVLAAVQEIPLPKRLPSPSPPRGEPANDGQAAQRMKNLIDSHDHDSVPIRQDLSHRFDL